MISISKGLSCPIFSDMDEFIKVSCAGAELRKLRRKGSYWEIAAAFDIETTSFYKHNGVAVLDPINDDDERQAVMYGWTFCIMGYVYLGRTWKDLTTLCDKLTEHLNLGEKRRLVVGVHNLAWEFQFMRKHFEWHRIFSLDTRKPVYAITTTGIEFRCTYLLSGYPLAMLARQLRTYKIAKMVGDLDYHQLRHTGTTLTDREIGYMINDTRVVCAYLAEQIEIEDGIENIPLTKTGYVRRYCRSACLYTEGLTASESTKTGKFRDYRNLMYHMKLQPDEYLMNQRAFQGGFTHANPFYSGKEMLDVTSFDFTSSYPAVMLSEQYPMSSGEYVVPQDAAGFWYYMKYYCCIFDVQFTGLESRIYYESFFSESRCWKLEDSVINNGRVVSASTLATTITNVDLQIVLKMYKWKSMKIANLHIYKRDYLPTDFVKSILKLYADKTELKGVSGREYDYLVAKEMLNSCYGMAVTNIVRDVCDYEGDMWLPPHAPDLNEELEKYNKSFSRFLFYPWGVFVTAYARRNLFTGILHFGASADYIYSDTDSVKVMNADAPEHVEFIRKYNEAITRKLDAAMDYHKLPRELTRPKTVEGVSKPLGVWDYDGHYRRFKTLGAKRYMIEDDEGNVNITVSGLNKTSTVPYLVKTYGDKVFDAFNNDLYVPAEYTGKNLHTYLDEPCSGIMTDLNGQAAYYEEASSIHLSAADYSLSIAREYADYLKGVITYYEL